MSRGEAPDAPAEDRPSRVHALAPTGRRDALVWWATSSLSRAVFRTAFRVRRSDVPILPEEPLILAPNHASFLDPLLIGGFVGRRVTFMMTARYYDAPLFKHFYRSARCIVVEEGGNQRRALREAAEVLENGRTLVIFPEGSISLDGRLQELQPGCAWIARRSGAPVYPVHLSGTHRALRKGARWPRLCRMGLSFGEPLRTADFGEGRASEQAFTRHLREELERLRALAPPID